MKGAAALSKSEIPADFEGADEALAFAKLAAAGLGCINLPSNAFVEVRNEAGELVCRVKIDRRHS